MLVRRTVRRPRRGGARARSSKAKVSEVAYVPTTQVKSQPVSHQVIVPVQTKTKAHVPAVVVKAAPIPVAVMPQKSSIHEIVKQHGLVSRGLNSLGLSKLGGIASKFGYGKKKRRTRRKRA